MAPAEIGWGAFYCIRTVTCVNVTGVIQKPTIGGAAVFAFAPISISSILGILQVLGTVFQVVFSLGTTVFGFFSGFLGAFFAV